MIYKGNATISLEKGEPAFRSCWECNSAHDHLKDRTFLHLCFICGRYFLFGVYLDTLETDDAFDKFMHDNKINVGQSTIG